MKKDDVCLLIYLIVILLGSFMLGFSVEKAFFSDKNEIKTNYAIKNNTYQYTNLSYNCENLSIFNASKCASEWVRTFYKYNQTEDSIHLTLDELKLRGGDCLDWSRIYEKMGKDLGFYSKILVITTSENNETIKGHAFTIWSNNKGYCKLDEENYECLEFNNGLE